MVFFIYSFKAIKKFYQYKHISHTDMVLNYQSFILFFQNVLLRDCIKLSTSFPNKDSKLDTFEFFVKGKDLDKLNANLPVSGEEYVKAELKINDENKQKIRLKYRGDSFWHWLYDQKSLRVNLKNNNFYNNENKFNLVNMPHADGYYDMLVFDLARQSGIIAPDSYPVRIFINNVYMGVYMFLTKMDETLIRKLRRMPGSIYEGDMGYAPDNENGVNQLWFDPKYWKKISSRNEQENENKDDINLFINAINQYSDKDFYEFFNTYINKNKFYSYFAIDTIFGIFHHDFFHNHKIYFDPYSGKFEPIEWNPVLRSQNGELEWYPKEKTIHGESLETKDVSVYPFLNKVKLNPILEAERDKKTYDLLGSKNYQVENVISQLELYKANFFPDLQKDIYRDDARYFRGVSLQYIAVPFTMDYLNDLLEMFKGFIKKRYLFLDNLYNNTQVVASLDLSNKMIQFKIDGNSPIIINFGKIIKNGYIYKDLNLNKILDDGDVLINSIEEILYPGRKVVPLPDDEKPWYGYIYGDTKIINTPLYYTFPFDGEIDISNLEIFNYITKHNVQVKHEDFEINNDESDSIHPWLLPSYEEKSVNLSGAIAVKEDLIFDEYTAVNIDPGTIFSIYPDKSIFIYGKLNAIGTKENPIKFIAYEKDKPWGAFILQGEKANESKMDFVEFDEGSIANRNLIYYSGQFNIHDVDNFIVSNCKVSRNFVGDDNMHIAYGSGVVDGCVFDNSNSDALDIDIADVTVKKSVFINSGNDLLDLMTSQLKVTNNIFINGGDKCISTGEATNGDYENNFFDSCNIAIQVKDNSEVDFGENLIMNSKEVAINLYHKNFMYEEGGILNADIVYLIGNKDDITFDSNSYAFVREIKVSYPNIENFLWLDNMLNLNKDWNNLDQAIENLKTIYAK